MPKHARVRAPLVVSILIGGALSGGARAQESAEPAAPVELPPLNVEATKAKKGATKKQAKAKVAPQTVAAPEPANKPSQGQSSDNTPTETATGPVKGYVATRTATVSKTDAAIIETPQAVNVISAQQLADQDAETLSEAVRYTPGVTSGFYGGGDTRDDPITIRGFEANQFWDGLVVPGGFTFAAGKPEPYGLERIEILKGPASVLYGQSAPGGLVNMISKRPTEEARGEVIVEGGLGAGSFERLQKKFDVSGPVDGDKSLLYRFVGLARDADTMVDDQPDDRLYFAPSFTWKPSADTTITWLNHYSRDSGGVFQQLPAMGTIFGNPNGKLPISRNAGESDFDHFTNDYWSTGYQLDHRFNHAVKFSQAVRYGHYRDDYSSLYINGLQADLRTVDRTAYSYGTSIDAFSIDNRLAVDFNTGAVSHSTLVGLDYTKTDFGYQLGFAAGPSIDIFNPVYLGYSGTVDRIYHTDSDSRNTGLYAQDIIRFGEFTVMAGVRHDWVDDRTVDRDTTTSGQSVAEQDPSATTYRAGAVYQFENGFAPYASYSESFELVPGTDGSGQPFQPTTGQQYEVGLRYLIPGINAMTTLSVFDLYQQNVLTPDPSDPFESIQTGEVNVRGVELETKASLNNWDVTGGVSYLDGKVSKTTIPGQLGMQAAKTPEWIASLWLDYHFDRSGPLRGLTTGGGVRYVGSFFSYQFDGSDNPKVPDTTLFDAHLAYDLGELDKRYKGFSLNMTATNVFNEQNFAVVTSDFATYGPGREVTASIAYRW